MTYSVKILAFMVTEFCFVMQLEERLDRDIQGQKFVKLLRKVA